MPGSSLGTAVLDLTVNKKKLKGDLRESETATKQSLTRMQRLGEAAATAAPYAAIGAAALGAGVAIKGMVDDVAAAERELRPFLQRSNLTVESLQQWQEIGRRLGAEDPLEGITDSIQEFKLRLGELETEGVGRLKTALPALGLELEDLRGKTPEEQFRLLLTALQGVDNETRRLYLADELFGGAMENIIGILQAQRTEFEAVETAVRNTHNVLSGAELQKLHVYNDAVDELGNSWTGVKQDLVTSVAPALSTFLRNLTQDIEDSKESFAESKKRISEWDDNFVEVVLNLATMVDGIETETGRIPGIIGDVMTDEEADIAGYFAGQKEPIRVSMAEIAEVAKTGAEGIASDFALKISAMGSATADALLGSAGEGEGSMIGPSVADAFYKMPPEVKKIIDQGFGEYITPSWKAGLSNIGSATWDAFYGSAEGEGGILPIFDTALNTTIPDYITNAVPTITDETDYLMEGGIQTPVETGFEEVQKLVAAGMDTMEEEVEAAVSPMSEAVTDYGERSIVQPITTAIVKAGQRVREELASMAEAVRGFDSMSVATGVAGHQGFDPGQWELRNDGPGGRFGGDYYYNPETGESISTRLYQSRRLAHFAGRHNEVLAGAADRDNPLAEEYFRNQPAPSLPGLPSMDSGGIVSGPTLAALAMNSRPEAVIPLDKLSSMGFGGGVHFHGPVYGFDDFADRVQEANLLGARRGRRDVL